MNAWAVKDATRTWDSVFDRAWAGEPQFVSRDGARTVVIVSLQAHESARRTLNHSVLDVLRRSRGAGDCRLDWSRRDSRRCSRMGP